MKKISPDKMAKVTFWITICGCLAFGAAAFSVHLIF